MPGFVVEGRGQDESLIAQGLTSLGARTTRALTNLARLSGAAMFITETPEGVDDAAIKALPGVRIVEGTFYHPFYILPPLIPPTEALAVLSQMLPPRLYGQLPREVLVNLTAIPVAQAGALGQFNPSNEPFGAPGLFLGPGVGRAAFENSGDLQRMLDLTRTTNAQALNQGQGAVIAVVDSGVAQGVIPSNQVIREFTDDPSRLVMTDPVGHGSMVGAIALAAAPSANFIIVRPQARPDGAMVSLSTLTALDYLAGIALEIRTPIISNHSWGIYGVKNLSLPCNVSITRAMRLLDGKGLVMTSWALGNNRHLAGDFTISGYCMASAPFSAAAGAVDRNLRPQFYSSLGGQCSLFQPVVVAPTFGVLPWGGGYRDLGEQGGATSSCAPQLSGALAMMMTAYPGRPFREYRAALRASANNGLVGYPGVAYNPLTGAGLLQADLAIKSLQSIAFHPWAQVENLVPTSIPVLGQEEELLR